MQYIYTITEITHQRPDYCLEFQVQAIAIDILRNGQMVLFPFRKIMQKFSRRATNW